MMASSQHLRRYRENGDEAAFAEVVRLELPLVYSTALRQLQNRELAKDVTQVVFADLAKKAALFSDTTMISGWLYQHTCFVAAKTRRKEQRRRLREEKVMQSDESCNLESSHPLEIASILDQAIQDLKPEDRTALVLRFFRE